jgi:sodium/bile acid cotransporter 7
MAENVKSPPWWRKHGFLLALAGAALAAALRPEWGSSTGFLHADRWNVYIVTALFFISGLTLRTADVPAAVADWRLHVFTQGFNLVFLPALFWAAAKALSAAGVDAALCTGLIVLGALSTTTASGVVLTRAAGGDEIGALFNAVLGSLLGVAVSPALILLMTGHYGSGLLEPIMKPLALQVMVPLAAGQAFQYLAGKTVTRMRPCLGPIGQGLLALLVWTVLCGAFARGRGAPAGEMAAAAATVGILHVTALGAAFFSSGWRPWRLTRPRRTAGIICGTQKSAALGVPLLYILFKGKPALGIILLPLLIYHPLQIAVASFLTPRFHRWNFPEKA